MSEVQKRPSGQEPGFSSYCEGLATDLRYHMGLLAFDPLPARQLAQHLKAQLFAPDHLNSLHPDAQAQLLESDHWSAALISRHPLAILYHPRHSERRTESSLMHEFAHFLLDHPFIGFDPKTHLPKIDTSHEREAAFLGGCLQLPRRGLLWARQLKMTVQETADHFRCSEAMVKYRSNVTRIKLR